MRGVGVCVGLIKIALEFKSFRGTEWSDLSVSTTVMCVCVWLKGGNQTVRIDVYIIAKWKKGYFPLNGREKGDQID